MWYPCFHMFKMLNIKAGMVFHVFHDDNRRVHGYMEIGNHMRAIEQHHYIWPWKDKYKVKHRFCLHLSLYTTAKCYENSVYTRRYTVLSMNGFFHRPSGLVSTNFQPWLVACKWRLDEVHWRSDLNRDELIWWQADLVTGRLYMSM